MAYATDLDPELAAVEAIRNGDRAAFEAFVGRNARWVRGVLFGVLGDRDRVDDVGQQVWQSVWTQASKLRDVAQWRSWLYRLARNAAVDAGREHTRRKRLGEAASDLPATPADPSPATRAIGREQHEVVLRALAGLPALYRQPFVLRHLEGWSYGQIAEVMEMPAATVETRLVRARQLLREALRGKV